MVRDQTGCTLKVAPINRRGEVELDRFLAHALPAHAARGDRACLQRARHGPAGEEHDRRRACARRRGAGRRRPGRSPHSRRRTGPRLRLLRLLRPQALRPDRHRRALRPGGAARRHAALAGRRRHDPHRLLREDDLQRAALEVRGRHAQHFRGRRPRRGDGLRRGPGSRGDRRARAAAARARHPRAGAHPRHRDHRHRAAQGGGAVLHHGGRAPARPRHHPRCRGRRGAHRPPLRHAGDDVLRAFPATARASFGCYNTEAEVASLAAALGRAREVFA